MKDLDWFVVHLGWLFIFGFAGIVAVLVLISLQIERCRLAILNSFLMTVPRGPPGLKAVEYYEDGSVKRVETVPPDEKA